MPVLGRKPAGRTSRRAAQEEQLLAATDRLLEGGTGFADLNVEQISAEAGLSRTAFYVYFQDKRELLIRLVERAVAPSASEENSLEQIASPEGIVATLKLALERARANRGVFRAVVEAAAYDPAVAAFWREEVTEPLIERLEAQIRREQRADRALPVNARALAETLVAMTVASLYQHTGRAKGASDRRLVETLAAIAVRTIYGPVDDLSTKRRKGGTG